MAKIKSITRKKITAEKLYNLEVEIDNSFIANGIVVHNCNSNIIPILVGNLKGREITGFPAKAAKYENQIQFSEKYGDHCCENHFCELDSH